MEAKDYVTRIAKERDAQWTKSLERNWVPGRLGVREGGGYSVDVPGRAGYVYVSLGVNGERGQNVARNVVGATGEWTQIKMRREHGQLVIREADNLAGGSGGVTTLLALTDVSPTPTDGDTLEWDSGTGTAIWVAPTGGAGGAPSPHARNGIHHTGLEAWSNIDLSTSDLADLATRSHTDLTGVNPNDHHNQVHALVGSDHTVSGLTTNHVLKATGATTFAFASPQHSITDTFYHTITGSTLDVVGATGTNTLGMITPSSSPGANARILRTDSNGSLSLDTSLFVADASTDVVTFDTNLLVINASPNTITSAAAWTNSAAWIFNGAVTLNSNGTFNTGVFRFNTDPQIDADLDFIGTERTITSPSTVNLNINPGGDLVLNPTGQDVLPGGSILVDLGDYNRKWRTLFAAELYVETLVAQDVLATIGGRIMVAPTTTLIADVSSGATTIDVKHNNLTNGSYIMLQTAPGGVAQFEIMKTTSTHSVITGGYRYSVTRNLDGTGANGWVAGDAVVNVGRVVGEGYIDLTSTSTIHNHLGPTITIYSRTGTAAWTDTKAVVSMGNLESFVDYSGPEFGFATGNDLTLSPATGFSGLTADRTNGIRLFNTSLEIYDGSDLAIMLNQAQGLRLLLDDVSQANELRHISWHSDLDPLNTRSAFVMANSDTSDNRHMSMGVQATGSGNESTLTLTANQQSSFHTTSIQLASGPTFGNLDANGMITLDAGRIFITGNVGIGTGAPGVNLVGTYDYPSNFDIVQIEGDRARLIIRGETDAGIDLIDSDAATNAKWGQILSSAGSTRIRSLTDTGTEQVSVILGFDHLTGNVGVGTLTPGVNVIGATDYASSARVLQVDGTRAVLLARGSTDARFDLIDTGGTADQRWFRFIMDGSSSYMRAMDDDDVNYVSLLTFNHSTGAAGIGTTTPTGTESTSKFTVEGSAAGSLYTATINTGAGQVGHALRRSGTTPSRWVTYIPGGSDNLRFYSGTFAGDVLTLTEDGCVGINDGAPTARLDVHLDGLNGVRTTNYGTTTWYNTVTRRALGTSGTPTQVTNSTILGIWGVQGYTSSGWPSTTSGEVRFIATESHTSSARGTKFMVSVMKNGTTTLATGLDIGDDRQFFAPGAYAHVLAYDAGTGVIPNLHVSSDGQLRRLTGLPSSIRYKENIEAITFPEHFFDKLTPVSYNYKDRAYYGETRRVGLIAEEMQEAGGEMFVMRDERGEIESINYERFDMALVWEIKNLRRRVAELEERPN